MTFEMDAPFLPAANSSRSKDRQKRFLILAGAAFVCVLIVIHHVRLEAAARRGPGPRGEPGMQGPQGPIGRTGDPGPRGPAGEPAFRGMLANGSLAGRVAFNERRLSAVISSLGWDTCGGHIEMINPVQELAYQVQTLASPVNCLWVVALRASASVSLSLVEDSVLHFNPDFSLKAFVIRGSDNCNMTSISPSISEVTLSSQLFFVLFSAQTSFVGEGFRLRMVGSDGGLSPWRLSLSKQASSFDYKYPPLSGTYDSDSKFALLGIPPEGSRANVTVYSIYTEATHDYVTLLYVDPTLPRGYFCQSRSGEGASSIEASVPSGMPFILYFRSDGSVTGRGFRVNGTYYNEE